MKKNLSKIVVFVIIALSMCSLCLLGACGNGLEGKYKLKAVIYRYNVYEASDVTEGSAMGEFFSEFKELEVKSDGTVLIKITQSDKEYVTQGSWLKNDENDSKKIFWKEDRNSTFSEAYFVNGELIVYYNGYVLVLEK